MEGKIVLNNFEKAIPEKALFWVRMLLLLRLRQKDLPEITNVIEQDFRLHCIWTPWKKYDIFELMKAHPDVPIDELLGSVKSLDLDVLLRSLDAPDLLAVFSNCLDELGARDFKYLESLFESEFGNTLSEEDQRSALVVNQISIEEIRQLILFIMNSVERGNLFDRKDFDLSLLVGSWKSVRETGELRINYNMTNLMPVGKTVFLTVEPHEGSGYLFVCLVKAMDYTTKEERLLEVYRSLVRFENGVLNHSNFWSSELFAQKPVYELTDQLFNTQIQDFEFDFQRIATIN